MAHVTFIHGISNKPDPASLLEQWRVVPERNAIDRRAEDYSRRARAWLNDREFELSAEGAAQESNALELEQGVDEQATDLTWLLAAPPEQQAFVARLAADIGLDNVVFGPGDQPDLIAPDSPLEGVPLPAPLKRRLMRVFLRDVHHYLFNATFSPRPARCTRCGPRCAPARCGALGEGRQQPWTARHPLPQHGNGDRL